MEIVAEFCHHHIMGKAINSVESASIALGKDCLPQNYRTRTSESSKGGFSSYGGFHDAVSIINILLQCSLIL